MKTQANHRLVQIDSKPGSTAKYPALLAYGFRPFFLLAGIHAAIAIPLWIAQYVGLTSVSTALPPSLWHAHEMLYGFIAAAMAGFLLTAVPSWTSHRGYAGVPLAGLVALWLAGRVVMTWQTGLPGFLAAAIDLAFLPVLALTLLPALLRSGNRRNLVFIGLLAILFASNLHFHLAGAESVEPLRLGVGTMLFLVTLLGGRVVPAFTSAALKQIAIEVRIRRYQPLDKAALFSVAAVVAIDLLWPESTAAAIAAACAAVLLALQLSSWQGHRALSMPIVWILHLAYAWLPICFLLKAVNLLQLPIPASSWLHAATTGAMATMIMAIMSRAALGHTGRPLVTPGIAVAAYVLLTCAALLRVFATAILPASSSLWLQLAAAAWCLAFVLFLLVYAPILCRPRADGKPG